MVFKKSITLVFTLFMFFSVQFLKAQEEVEEDDFHHSLVSESSFTFGLGVPYTFNFNTAGINSRLYFNPAENICLGPEFSYFNSDEAEIWDVDFVIHYIIEIPVLGLYPVVGINYTEETEEHHGTESAWGFLWGGGVHRNVNRVTFFFEYTRVAGDLHDEFITGGLMYHFNIK